MMERGFNTIHYKSERILDAVNKMMIDLYTLQCGEEREDVGR